MGSLKVTLCAGVAVVAAVLVPTAYAAGEGGQDGGGSGSGSGSVSVTPSAPSPGADVTLKVTGCGGRTATAASDAFVADARLVSTGDTLVGDTRVRSSLEPGGYDVRITCVGSQLKGRIEVVASSPSHRSAAPATTPVAPVQAGGGGAAPLRPLAAEGEVRADVRGPGTAQTVIGLVLAGVAATVVAFRGMRSRRGAE
ncbi:hypothetical protein [Streptomyces sp. ME18-1-4]|uniref:hypothetical protein n=1 Tax=Streptomyces sp. ME18-1-4 TaxID=3028685 RepID=UPI0029ACC150|nr:hypothetical protein [Streptomyces sp. ME18-1-4]MDX3247034.1 hypothetical protein [Streptomyces sp. ME18-1-4]